MNISTEALAYWYLRLNGFLTITNFIIHTEWRRDFPTEADIIGVRFPYRKELDRRPLEDDKWIQPYSESLLIVVAKVKTGLCRLNGPWTDPCRKNVNKVLAAIGCFPERNVRAVAEDLYLKGFNRTGGQVTLLAAFGEEENAELHQQHPEVKQILFFSALDFIYHRFTAYIKEKSWHQPWNCIGEGLFELARKSPDLDSFVKNICLVPPDNKPTETR